MISHLLSLNHIKFYSLSITNAAQVLPWIVFLYRRLERKMNKNILFYVTYLTHS